MDLVANHDAAQIRDALDAVEARRPDNPAGWLVRAISDGWDVASDAATVRRRRARHAAEEHTDRQRASGTDVEACVAARLDGWARAVSAALDDYQLAAALAATTTCVGGVGRRAVGLSRAQLLAWAITVAARDVHRPLADVLAEALTDDTAGRCDVHAMDDVPEAPTTPATAVVADLSVRIRQTLQHDVAAPPTAVVDR